MLSHQCIIEQIHGCKNILRPHFFWQVSSYPHAACFCFQHPPRIFSRTILFRYVCCGILNGDSSFLESLLSISPYATLLISTKSHNTKFSTVSTFHYVSK